MRVVLQRVSTATVRVDGVPLSSIGPGLCLLVGVARGDDGADVEAAVAKLSTLRVFADELGKMNLSVEDVGGEVMVISQFTLYGDVRRGRRPSFTEAAPPAQAEPLIDQMIAELRRRGLSVAQGSFGAKMEVALVNDGPVTLTLEVSGGVVT